MILHLKNILSITLLFYVSLIFGGQPQKIDSLKNELTQADNAKKIELYNILSKEVNGSDPKLAEVYARKALDLAFARQDKKGLGDAFNSLGRASYFNGNYSLAIEHYMKSFIYRQQLNDTVGMANSLSNIGVMYRKMNDYGNALDYYMKALSLKEKLDNKNEILSVLNNIGGLYYYQRNFVKATEYYTRTLELATAIKDSGLIAATCNNLSLISDDNMNYTKALELANKSLSIREKLYDLGGVASAYNNLGRIYEHMSKTSLALRYYIRSLALFHKLGDFPGKSNTLYNIGSIYLKSKNYNTAISYFDSSLVLAKNFKLRLQIRDNFHGLAHAWHYTGNADKSFRYFLNFIDMNDSLYNEESLEKISEMEVKYQSDRKVRDIEMLKRENELKDLKRENENKRQVVITRSFIGGLLVALVFVFLLLNRNNIRKKANKKLQLFNNEIVKQKEEVEKQKKIVDEKNKEIVDSINYAQRIQQAILPVTDEIEKFFKESFILFKPKDIVSGDFYWLAETQLYYFYATVDCTGHGVPGGFMSMLGNSLLNEVVIEKAVYEPSLILDMLREKIIRSLKQKGESGQSKDGMDMILCRISKDKKELVYAAANNPLWIVRDSKFMEYKADKQPVGISVTNAAKFSQTGIELRKGDVVYTFTDGFADQFGGKKGKKFKYKQFSELLFAINEKPMQQQRELLDKTFDDWRGELEQVDDVLIIGIRV